METARELGAEVRDPGRQSLAEIGAELGPFERILITAPPPLIPASFDAAAYGGVIAFVGIGWEGAQHIGFDANAFHFRKLQLRASFASPALFLPEALRLLERGVVPAELIISHVLPLSRIAEALQMARERRPEVKKVVIVPDGRL